MKKLLLFLAASSIAWNTNAQERKLISIDGQQPQTLERHPEMATPPILTDSKYTSADAGSGAHKTTGVGQRWYNYSNYLGLKSKHDRDNGTGDNFLDFYGPVMWNDTINYTAFLSGSTYMQRHVTLVSLGTALHPQFAGFNRMDLFGTGSFMRVTDSDIYTVDSINLSYWYTQGTKATPGLKDTLRLAFNTGDGTAKTGTSVFGGSLTGTGHYGAISFLNVAYDSVINTSVTSGTGAATRYMDILLDHNTDTSVFGKSRAFEIKDKITGLAAPITVPAGQFVSCVMSFISAEPGAGLHSLPGDSLSGVGGRYYNLFQPFVEYVTNDDPASVTNTTPDWADYDATDRNEGLFKQLPNYNVAGWKNQYIPNWAWAGVPSGAYYYQYPDIGYHLKCSGCSDVPLEVRSEALSNNINAVPNPAANEVNITYSLTKASDISVSLTDMLGHVVAVQKLSNTVTGKAVINTETLPAGVYVYAVEANGERNTGRVVVAH